MTNFNLTATQIQWFGDVIKVSPTNKAILPRNYIRKFEKNAGMGQLKLADIEQYLTDKCINNE